MVVIFFVLFCSSSSQYFFMTLFTFVEVEFWALGTFYAFQSISHSIDGLLCSIVVINIQACGFGKKVKVGANLIKHCFPNLTIRVISYFHALSLHPSGGGEASKIHCPGELIQQVTDIYFNHLLEVVALPQSLQYGDLVP